MNMSTQLTYSGIGVAVFAQQLNLPMPSMLLLTTVGALASRGQENLQVPLVLLAGVIGCLAADGCWFWLGRRWGNGVIRVVCSFTSNPHESRERAHRIFEKWGLRLLLVAKFVPGLDGISPPLVGAAGASIGGFLLFDAIGAFLWTAFYVVVGFLFSNQLNIVMPMVQRFGMHLAILLGTPLFLYATWRAIRILRMIRHLRFRRISPALLRRKLDDHDKLILVDLQYYEAQNAELKAIPGAFRADPAKLRTVSRLAIPESVEVVLYCSSQNEFVSARVASAIQKKGVDEVWVLEGGLEAWMREGHAVTSKLATGEEAAARAGVILPPELRQTTMSHS